MSDENGKPEKLPERFYINPGEVIPLGRMVSRITKMTPEDEKAEAEYKAIMEDRDDE
jgi:hypothetical protein